MAETVAEPEELKRAKGVERRAVHGAASSTSLIEVWAAIQLNIRVFFSIIGILCAACLLYCLFAPRQYEATARIALRSTSESALAIDRRDAAGSGSFASGQVQLETLANVLRSEQVAWDVISGLKLYGERGFSRSFPRKFPEFTPQAPSPEAKEYLLEQFREDLSVESAPHTLVLEIRFRSRDSKLAAAVANEVIAAYKRHETESRVQATRSGTEWLSEQLLELKKRIGLDDQKLTAFQREHGILSSPMTVGEDREVDVERTAALSAVDSLSREAMKAAIDRILREAEYKAAVAHGPEMVAPTDGRSAGDTEKLLLQQLHTRRSDLEQEQSRIQIEHGPNFPRVVEIRSQLQDLDVQVKDADEKLLERFRTAWKTSLDREKAIHAKLEEATTTGLKASGAALQYSAMRQEAETNRQVYLQLMQQAEEAGMAAGSRGSAISVIDHARQPMKPVSPNLPVYLAITAFVSFWAALGAVLGKEAYQRRTMIAVVLAACIAAGANLCSGQAPTPSTSGLPTGVAKIPLSTETRNTPNPKESPTTWNSEGENRWQGAPPGTSGTAQPMNAPIEPGDMIEVTEAHGPEMHAMVRVSEAGTVVLPLAGEVHIGGMDERDAGVAIGEVLKVRGMLLHPQVAVLVTSYAGQDVSVLGEVNRPGVYAFTTHHRLLDLISAASGLSQNAGRLVTITHRNDPEKGTVVVLDPSGNNGVAEQNPELLAGDTVQVNRTGLIYVVGDVIRPGGFPVDRSETLTVVQALSLAWGPGQNAALKNAVLIREQPAGRTVTTLNLKRMLRGLDPDLAVRDRDILFVPSSTAKNLWNRSLESVIQSAAGVSIYSGLVYSQRF